MRLLPAFLAAGTGKFVLDGTPRLRERPIGPVLTALPNRGLESAVWVSKATRRGTHQRAA